MGLITSWFHLTDLLPDIPYDLCYCEVSYSIVMVKCCVCTHFKPSGMLLMNIIMS
jgi:hypothetical protein